MKHICNIILFFTTLLLSTVSGFAQNLEGEFMQVAAERVTVDDKRCYLIKKRYSRKDTIKWDPFCGEFSNFYYEEGYPYKLYVEKYDPHADTIHVIKTIGRDSSDPYMKQKELRRKKAKRDSIKAASESPVTEPDNKEKK
ncbi:MAG: DUF4377 domain-containing protein [Paludibacteraceae bacterium]|nr:DUF4377 domain-containing protein [Paludibacteraceae bacterium]MBP5481332.1 DUF4377 domain-containing protein [Paludibacteraceae bacterium]